MPLVIEDKTVTDKEALNCGEITEIRRQDNVRVT